MNEKQIEKILILLKVLQHLSEYFDKKLFQAFVFWISKQDLFKNFDEKIRELILEILAGCVSIYIDYEYKKMVIEFLKTFDKKNMKISPLILSTITNFYGLDRKVEVDLEPVLSSLVSKHFYSDCKHRFRFLMGSLDFIINNIKDKNYSVFVDSITEDTLGYFALLINFHYEDAMFNLFKCMLNVLTFVKKKFEKEKLVLFIQKLKEKNLFEINYNFDDENISKKLVDKDGFIQIDPEFVFKRLKNEIKIVSSFEKYNVDWGFFLVCEKYCEVRANKFGVLSDSSLLLCALHGNVGDIAFLPMLVVHSIFSDLHDLYELKNKILDKKDVLTFYGLENDNYDYFPLAYRNPNLIFMKDEPVYENLFESLDKHDETIDHCLRFLQGESTVHEKYLFVLSEILYNYPRYIRSIDLYYLQIMCECYLDEDLDYIKDPDKQIAARRALELFSICVHSRDPDFMITFIEFIKSILNGSINEIVNAIIILCNVSNPLNTLTSGLEHGVKDKNVFLAFTEFMKNDIFDLFVSVISKLNPNELPSLKELSSNSETLNTNLGMKNSSFFLLQNQIFGFDSYDISEFNSNSMNNSHDDLLNVALNFIYNVLYTIFQKEIEDSGICDIEISDDDLEDDFESTETFYEDNDNESSTTSYNETAVEEVFEDAENAIINEESKSSEESTNDAIPMIRSTYLRFETAFKAIEEDNMRLIFENISKLVSKVEEEAIENEMEEEEEETEVENDESEEEEDYSEESSVGVYDGFIPNKTTEEVNEMDVNEFEDFITDLMNERKSSSLDYKPIDKNYLDGLIEPFRFKFESQEAHLKDFYYPEIDVFSEKNEGPEITEIDIRLSENTVLNFIDAFYSGKFIGKPQVFNIFKIMSLSKTIREILLAESVSKLVKEVDDLKNESYDNNYENIRKSMELIRIVTLKFKLENEDQKIKVVRSLFKLLRHKSTAIKALHLLNKIEFENEIFDVNESDKLKEEMVLDILKLSEAWISKKTSNYLRNVIRKICKGTINILSFSIIDSITKEFVLVLNCDESLILQKFIESQSKILNLILIFDICFSSFFELFRSECKENIELFFMKMGTEHKNIENLDFKHLYNQILSQNTTQELISADSNLNFNFVDIIKSLNYLIKDCIEKLIRKLTKEKTSMIDYYYMSGLYNVYFLIFSVYEGLINHFCVFSSETKDSILEQYDELRNELGLFLNSNINEINSIFSVEKDVFSQNIRFLSRFNVINFVNKHNYFRGKIQDYDLYKEGTYTINVRRNDVLSDSLFQIMNKTSIEFKAKRLQVKFSGEEGLDFGGITREWVDLLVKDLTMPDKGLFVYTSDKKTTFLPYRNSKVNPDHLLYFRFVGRILAKSILDRITLDLQIDKSVYKYFLGKKCELSDLEPIDPQFYNSLIWMRDNTIEDVIVMTFSFEYLEFGELKTMDLKPNGRNITVTDENKQEYIDLIVDYKLFKGIEIQLNSMKTGLFEIIDRDLLSIFNENEFELLINGIPDINVDDWMNNTEYHGYKSNSTNIIWFWKAVRSFSPEERAKLLQFSTGSSRVPFEGFSHLQGNNGPQKFSIHKSSSDNVRLPSAHTCFNQLDLPEYPSFNDLRKSLIYAINECSEGFGLI